MWCIWHNWFISERAHNLLEKGLWCLHRWCSSSGRMWIWISTFGTEWFTKCHQNSLYDSLVNINNDNNAAWVTRSNERHYKFCQFFKGKHFKQSAVFTNIHSDALNKALLLQTEVRWLSRGSFKRCFWALWRTQNIFLIWSKTTVHSTFQQ